MKRYKQASDPHCSYTGPDNIDYTFSATSDNFLIPTTTPDILVCLTGTRITLQAKFLGLRISLFLSPQDLHNDPKFSIHQPPTAAGFSQPPIPPTERGQSLLRRTPHCLSGGRLSLSVLSKELTSISVLCATFRVEPIQREPSSSPSR